MPKSRGFFIQFLGLARQFWCSTHKWKIRAVTLLLATLTLLQNAIALWLNQWNADLFDALEQHSMQALFTQVMLLGLILVTNMAVTGTHLVVKRKLQIWWRDWLTEYVFSRWMRDGRHYLISHLPGEHDNPDGRIAEDCRIATESAVIMGHTLFYSTFLLISFTQVLWSLSGVVEVNVGSTQLAIHGHLVWIAILYTAIASWIGWRVSRPLTDATNTRQTAEANFRAGLLEARDNSQAIAFIKAEPYERDRFRSLFGVLREVWNQQTSAWRNIVLFSTGYSVVSGALPVLIASPRYILGNVSLGGLMQSAQAFQHMASALSWPVDNLGGIAEWRASVERILGLLKSLDDAETEIYNRERQWIKLQPGDDRLLALRNLTIAKFRGPVLAKNLTEAINAGERVLITGNTFTGAKLFRAIAGIRPWGSGVIELPKDGKLFFMPPRPYLPTGSLRSAICYPASPGDFGEESIVRSLRLVGLESLIDQLDQTDTWATALAQGEQQRLGAVRVLLNRPQWVFLQEAFDFLDPQDEAQMLRLICEQIPDVTLVGISHSPNAEAFYSRRLVL